MTTGYTPPALAAAVRIRGLRKSFGDKVVLDGIDLDIAEGTIFALLGPNGAGKTTIIQILSTLLPADGGEVEVAGFDVKAGSNDVRHSIGVTGQFSAVDQLLSGRENLRLVADLLHLDRPAGHQRADALLARFDLAGAAGQLVATYSGGMRRRLDLAMTLMGEPRIIFLDEPTSGLDPRSRRTMWEIVRELVADGVTILLTTQYLDEADQLADRIAVLDHGRIVAQGTPDELKARIPGGHVRLHFASPGAATAAAQAFGIGAEPNDEDALRVPTDGTPESLRGILDRLNGQAAAADRVTVHLPDLDDVFLALTGQTAGRPPTTTASTGSENEP
ncbi:MAG TPA: ATP-binding cassette domain-containing protein [Actinomycetota bacterium]|nr:ATP-binding cassette domain-containing protein [Actinomycetota bacterium]